MATRVIDPGTLGPGTRPKPAPGRPPLSGPVPAPGSAIGPGTAKPLTPAAAPLNAPAPRAGGPAAKVAAVTPPAAVPRVQSGQLPIDQSTEESQAQSVEDLIKSNFTDILEGKKGSFTDERLGLMKAGLFEETRAQQRASNQEAIAQAALTGTSRSGVLQRRFQDIDTSTRAEYTRGVREMLLEKAKAEWEDKMQGLQLAGDWLQQKRSYMIGKQQIAATLESARIQASATIGAAALHSAATRDAARASAGASRGATAEGARQFDLTRTDRLEQQNWENRMAEMEATGRALGIGG